MIDGREKNKIPSKFAKQGIWLIATPTTIVSWRNLLFLIWGLEGGNSDKFSDLL